MAGENCDEELEELDREKQTETTNGDLLATRFDALLDFYSDRAVAHASFLVASIFGLVTMLAIVQQLDENNIAIIWLSSVVFFGISYMGYFALIRFGFYADVAQKLTKGLNEKETLKQVKLVLKNQVKTNLFDYERKQGNLLNELLLPRKILIWSGDWAKPLLGISYWFGIELLGFIVFSKFWNRVQWSHWIAFVSSMVIIFVGLPLIYYQWKVLWSTK
jgi:hypothetical protein